MASLASDQERFDMGRVVSRAFGALSRNAALFLTLAIVLLFVPGILLQVLLLSLTGPETATDFAAFTRTRILSIAIVSIVNIFFLYIVSAAVSYATVMDQNGTSVDFGAAFKVGLQRAFPLLLLSIVSLVGIYFGLLLFVFPGIMFAIWWSVATPVLVNERLGVFASMGRSKALTKGSRWSIFGLLVVAVILLFIPAIITPLLTGALTDPQAIMNNALSTGNLISSFLSALANMVFAALVAAIYVELRTIKEGATSESLAAIFA